MFLKRTIQDQEALYLDRQVPWYFSYATTVHYLLQVFLRLVTGYFLVSSSDIQLLSSLIKKPYWFCCPLLSQLKGWPFNLSNSIW